MNGVSVESLESVRAIPPEVMSRVRSAEELMHEVHQAGEQIGYAFDDERSAYKTLQTAQESLEAELNEYIMDAEYQASKLKEGPLAGLAKTSDAYKIAVKNLRAQLLGGDLGDDYRSVVRAENAYREAATAYESAKARFQALRAMSDLQSNILRAMSA